MLQQARLAPIHFWPGCRLRGRSVPESTHLQKGGCRSPFPRLPSPRKRGKGGGRCCIAHAHSAVGRCHAFSLVTMMCRGPQTLCRAVPSAVFVPVALS